MVVLLKNITICQKCLKQNNRMGNQIPPGIPLLLAKNWQPVPDHPNSFRNKLTFQYTHKHIINVQDPLQIQSFKIRMKETNPYICRVLFYHQYHESIYHVFTDEIHLQPNVARADTWRGQKIKIIESFWQLAQVYGYFKVCKQMIGADSNLHPKIWIHPDPISPKPWSSCNSQAIMLSDIITIINGMEEKASPMKSKKQINKTILTRTQTQYTTFTEYIQAQMNKLNAQLALGKTKLNRTSAFIENNNNPGSNLNTTNLNININIELDEMSKKRNKTNLIGSPNANNYPNPQMNYVINANEIKNINNYTTTNYVLSQSQNNEQNYNCNYQYPYAYQNSYPIQPKEPRYSNVIENSKTIKLQRLFNTNPMDTARREEAKSKNMTYGENKLLKIPNKKNLSLERPVTCYPSSPQYDRNNLLTDSRRRDTQSFKVGQQPDIYNANREKSIGRLRNRIKQSETNFQQKQASKQTNIDKYKNPLVKLMTETARLNYPSNIYIERNRVENKSTQGFQHSRGGDSSFNIQNPFKSPAIKRRQQKYTNIPNFLMKSNTELEKEVWKHEMVDKHPSTERQNRQYFEQKQKQQAALIKEELKTLPARCQEESQEDNEISRMRPRKNTVAILKQQLNNILETVIEPQSRPVSRDYQNFKTTKIIYKPQNFFEAYIGDSQQDDKDEIDMIKEKVQQKRVRFAQLKLDARKILQDSI